MTERLLPDQLAPDAYAAVRSVETYIRGCGLRAGLIELVKMRASQINGCAFCLDMHAKDARRAWRDRAAAVSAERVAGVAALYRPRTGRAGLDRMPDPRRDRRRARRRLRRPWSAVHRQGDRRSHRADRGDQPVEPPGHRHALRARRHTPRMRGMSGITLRDAETDAEIGACFAAHAAAAPASALTPDALVARVRRQRARAIGCWPPGARSRCGPGRLPAAGEPDARPVLLRRRPGGARRSATLGLGARLLDAVAAAAARRRLPHLVLDTALDNSLASGSISASACCRRRCGSRCRGPAVTHPAFVAASPRGADAFSQPDGGEEVIDGCGAPPGMRGRPPRPGRQPAAAGRRRVQRPRSWRPPRQATRGAALAESER